MNPAPRDLPVIPVVGPFPDRSFTVLLPGGLRVVAKTQQAVEDIVKRHAPYSAIHYSRPGGGWPADES